MNKPTDKQVELARKIADRLETELPKESTKSAYWKFINDNISEYKAKEAIVIAEVSAGDFSDAGIVIEYIFYRKISLNI